MTGLERIRAALRFEPPDRVPVAPLLGAHAVALAGLSHDQASRDAALQADALLAAVEAYQPDAVFTLMDLSVEPEALGAVAEARPGQPSVIVRHLTPDQLETDALEQRILTARVPVFIETVSRLRRALDDSLLIGALVSGPLTALSNAIGIADLSRMLRRDRDRLASLLARLTSAVIALQRRHLGAGAHAVVLLEPLATTSILSPRDLEALLLPELQRITTSARDAGLISILHVCGDCTPSLPHLARTGAHALSLDSVVDLPAARHLLGDRVALMGNLDVRGLLPTGSPEDVRRAASHLASTMGQGFILSTGCELPPDTPKMNLMAVMGAG
jgi:uroporphyrinogen decarboxylase